MSDVGARRRTAVGRHSDVRPGIHRVLVGIVVALALGSLLMMVLLVARPQTGADAQQPLVSGTVVNSPTSPPAEGGPAPLPPGALEVDLTVRLDDTGAEVQVPRVLDPTGDSFQPGARVRLRPQASEGEPVYALADLRREGPLVLLAALFVVAVLAFGRFSGLRALVGLALSAVVVIAFLVPTILAGRNAMLVALTAAVAIVVLTQYLAHGPNPRTTAAVVATAATLLLTGGLAWVVLETADIAGLAPAVGQALPGGIPLQGLLLAGVVLGALGVLGDVTVSQASLVFDLAAADPRASRSALVRRALHLGRSHVIATVNTLFLAYAGASLPVLILFATGVDSVPTVLTSQVVALEIVRMLIGSLGLIAAVPLTSALSAALAARASAAPSLPALPTTTGPLPDLREVEEDLWREPVAAADPRLATAPLGQARRPSTATAETVGAPRLRAVSDTGGFAQPAASGSRVWAAAPSGSVTADERHPQHAGAQRVGGSHLRSVEQAGPDAGYDPTAETERPYQTRRERAAAEREQRSRRRRRQPEAPARPEGLLALPAVSPSSAAQAAAPKDPVRKRRKTAADAEVEQLEDWFRQLRNPYGNRNSDE